MLSKETFEINSTEHRKAQRISKIRNLAKGNKNPAEKAAAEKKAGGPKLVGETKEIKEVWGAVAKVAMGAAKTAAKGAVSGAKSAVKQKAKQVIRQKAVNVAKGAIPQPNRDQQEGVLGAAAGAVLGSAVGGPLGAVAGGALGSKVDVLGKKKVTGSPKKKATNFFKAEKSDTSEGVVAFVKKGLERDKKAKKEKDIKNRKAVPYAALAAETQPEGELVDETYFDTNRRGISTKGGFSKQYNKPGKLSRASLNHERKSKDPELRMSKKELRKSMEDDANYEKKMGRSKPTPSNLKSALKKQSRKEEVELTLMSFQEKTRYAKETGKSYKSGKAQPKGGSAKGDAAFKSVIARIKSEYGKNALAGGEGQIKKKKGEKGRQQPGDRRLTPADQVARRRQSKKDAEAAMRDTRGT